MKLRRGVLGHFALAVGLASTFLVACGSADAAKSVRLNELQMIGTHNSYHVEPPRVLLQAITAFDADFAKSVQYGHPPLAEQLDGGVRLLELDVYADPEGRRFANHPVLAALGLPSLPPNPELDAPGFKVLHVAEIDFLTSCWTLKSCLGQIREWSQSHPEHAPIVVLIEPRDEPTPDPLRLGFVVPLGIGARELEALEGEILSVLPRSKLLTPDDVRGKRASLEEAVLKDGWPTLRKAQGKIMFVLLDEAEKRAAYRAKDASLRGRLLFTTSTPGEPDAAVVKLDEAINAAARIEELVKAGYLVRTRADADTVEARLGDTARRDAALASGAHLVSTDFTYGSAAFGRGYVVTFDGGARIRCNVVTASSFCHDLGLASR